MKVCCVCLTGVEPGGPLQETDRLVELWRDVSDELVMIISATAPA